MSPILVEIVGLIAATLTTISFLPQAIKVIKTRDTSAISLLMYIAFTGGVACWLIYGILIINWPIIIANLITVCLASTILYFKVHHG